MMLFKTVSYTTKKLKNKTILNLKQYRVRIAMYFSVMYSNYFEALSLFIVHWPTKDLLRRLDLMLFKT